jgi:hypothetical protein
MKEKTEYAYIALVGFAGNAALLKDRQGNQFFKTIADIQKEFPTSKELTEFLKERLTDQSLDPNYTDITQALAVGYDIYQGAMARDLSRYGIGGEWTLMEHHPVKPGGAKDEQLTVPNVRVLIYSDGEYNPPDGKPLANPFANEPLSVLMTVYMGGGQDEGAKQMQSLACTCPTHSVNGYFLINNPERYQTLRYLFRMASGTTGFCATCLSEARKAAGGAP